MTQVAGRAVIAEEVTDGAIVDISSMLAKIVDKRVSAYSTSEAVVAALSKVAAKELASHGIRVNTVQPPVDQSFQAESRNALVLLRVQRRCIPW
ncbi:hypothetical protein HPB47_011257 [Ixodes persulcatus]|uniref:Uncharacterized protein n=1 Tax=Ixodes persulcatus TaxID=34615 RepID=A0AC60NWX7_IXOPE|nr:hypothetical protein HPB47_011257 [Ixodes persulcatus]